MRECRTEPCVCLNAIAIGMLFLTGYAFGTHRPDITRGLMGIAMVVRRLRAGRTSPWLSEDERRAKRCRHRGLAMRPSPRVARGAQTPAATHRPPRRTRRRRRPKRRGRRWSFAASAYTYVVPDDHDYVQPTVTADRGWLHLEARYNYEALDTGSAWVGYNFSGGETLAWEFTPMIGGVFGDTTGIAPGLQRCRSAGGSSNSRARASTSSTRATPRRASSTTGRS